MHNQTRYIPGVVENGWKVETSCPSLFVLLLFQAGKAEAENEYNVCGPQSSAFNGRNVRKARRGLRWKVVASDPPSVPESLSLELPSVRRCFEECSARAFVTNVRSWPKTAYEELWRIQQTRSCLFLRSVEGRAQKKEA